MSVLGLAGDIGRDVVRLPAEAGGEEALFQVNLFWVIVSAINFVLFFLFAPLVRRRSRGA